MSARIDKNFLSIRDINQIRNDCFIEGRENDYGPANTLKAYGETSTSIYIPFAYAKERFKASPNKDTRYPATNYTFHSDLYPFRTDGGRDQQIVFNEAMRMIKKHRTVLLSLHCGYGKCLAFNTPILLYDGNIKMVQNVIEGDLLMGDDSTPREVLSLARGREEMYTIVPKIGDSYTVNKSHILSLRISENKTISRDFSGWNARWFDHQSIAFVTHKLSSYDEATAYLSQIYSPDIVDISVEDYLKLDDEITEMLLGYRVAVDYPSRPVPADPYALGRWLKDENEVPGPDLWNVIKDYNLADNKHIPHIYKANSQSVRLKLLEGLHGMTCTSIVLMNDITYIARSVGLSACFTNNTVTISSTEINTKIKIVPCGVGDYYGFTIGGNHRFLLGDFTVTHNTYTGIRLAHQSGLKCAVLAHRGILFNQWIESIQKFTTAKVQRVDTDGILDPEADFYIFNIAYVSKSWNKTEKKWKPKKLGIYKDIGTLIVDEAHIAGAAEMSKALLYFNPRISIALTATPMRSDGMDRVLELYFGSYNMTRIIRIAKDPFTVYRLATGIKPEFTRNSFGKKDWNSVIQYLVNCEPRNKLILDLIVKFDKHNILVLTKRKSHCTYLSGKLNTLGITNTVMVGTSQEYDKKARVLLSTYSKLGVGFDDTRLNMLIIACSVTEVEQYAGRLRDGKDKKRIIVDLVDNDSNCQSHWTKRRAWYLSRNGIIKNYQKEFTTDTISGRESPEACDKQATVKRLSRKL